MLSKNIAVLGLGKSGLSTVNFLLKNGIVPTVFDTREKPFGEDELPKEVTLIKGDFDGSKLSEFDLLIIGPGLPLSMPSLQQALTKGVEIIGDIELFAHYVNKPTVGITGSNGKSTVTTLVALMAKADGKKCGMGGNIGIAALDIIDEANDVYVLELSSFQLETTKSLNLVGCTILNLSEDHLDRYDGSMKKYLEAKQRIFNNATNIIVNRDDAATIPPQNGEYKSFGLDNFSYGRVVDGEEIYLSVDGEKIININDVLIKGTHNQANALAAMALADTLGISREAQVSVLKSFKGLEHRCQHVRTLNGVTYYNDSKATNVGSTLAAVSGLKDSIKGKLILLAGGLGKGQDFTPIKNLLGKEVAKMYCYGKDGLMLSKLGAECELVEDMQEAIYKAKDIAIDGDVVLLAPACASLDQFKSFEERGNVFENIVKDL